MKPETLQTWLDGLERLHEELAPGLLTASTDEILDLIAHTVERVSGLLDLDCSSIAELSEDRHSLRVAVSWSAPGIDAMPKLDLREHFPAMVEKSLRGEVIRYPTTEALGPLDAPIPDIRRWPGGTGDGGRATPKGPTSFAIVPLQMGGSTIGAYVLATRRAPRQWPDELIAGLRLLALPIANSLARKQCDAALQKSRAELEEVQRVAHIGDWTSILADGKVSGSPQLFRIFEIDPDDELDMRTMAMRLCPEDRDRFERQITDWMAGRQSGPQEYRLALSSSAARHVRCWGEVTSDVDGSPMRVLGVAQDITERKHIEEALRQLSRRLLRAHEDERSRIARELHDDLGQRMAVLNIQMDLLAQQAIAGAEADSLATTLAELARGLGVVASDIRRLSHALHPSKLQSLGLVGALRALCRDLGQIHDIELRFHERLSHQRIPDAIALCLYRIAQEALRNVITHSGARDAALLVEDSGEEISLSVSDDGVGFDPDALHPSEGDAAGLGLLGMRERLRLVNGELVIQSHIGRGTRIQARVPLPDTESEENQLVDDGQSTVPVDIEI